MLDKFNGGEAVSRLALSVPACLHLDSLGSCWSQKGIQESLDEVS